MPCLALLRNFNFFTNKINDIKNLNIDRTYQEQFHDSNNMLFDFITNVTNISITTLIHVFVKTEIHPLTIIVFIIQFTFTSLKSSTLKISSLKRIHSLVHLLSTTANSHNWHFCIVHCFHFLFIFRACWFCCLSFIIFFLHC